MRREPPPSGEEFTEAIQAMATGYANGALKTLPAEQRKQNIYFHQQELTGEAQLLKLDLRKAGLMDLPTTYTVQTDFWAEDDTVVFAVARNAQGQVLDLTGMVEGETLCWDKPAGEWTLQIGFWSRNMGGRRENICVIEEEGVQILIDAVYEPHWQHYAADFGKTIQGFFSDEPELGNGRTYASGNRMGTDQDLPWRVRKHRKFAVSIWTASPSGCGKLSPISWVTGARPTVSAILAT